MQRNLYSILGFSMHASDGEIGKVKEFYFDDRSWQIRYLIVETGSWLSGRKVLIPPVALLPSTREDGSFPVHLTMDQIRNSPDINTDKPFSRQQEVELFGFYPWQKYWDDGFHAEAFLSTPELPTDKLNHPIYDVHLRSTGKITGYHIHAADGNVGHVSDFIFDDQSWKLVYLVVNTRNWVGGKMVLIPVEDIREINWLSSLVHLNISIDKVKEARILDENEFTIEKSIFEREFSIK
jgi:uncharacterized protein YrrD